MKVNFYLLAAVLISCALGRVISLHQLRELETHRLLDGQEVEVIYTSDSTPEDPLQREHYVIKSAHRNKRTAYLNMQSILARVVRILNRYKLIPHEGSLVNSKIKPQYLSKKRKWSFSAIFVVLGDDRELRKCDLQFRQLGINKLNVRPSIHFLDEKLRALEIFAGAKAKLQKVLRRFPGFEIEEVEEIDFEGLNMPNSDIIERQIEEEFSHSEESMEESKIKHERRARDEKITLRVVFQVTDQSDSDSAEAASELFL